MGSVSVQAIPRPAAAEASRAAWQRQGEFPARLTRMRAMLHETRSKAAELESALQRFQERKAQIDTRDRS
jgi:hypothetical protein